MENSVSTQASSNAQFSPESAVEVAQIQGQALIAISSRIMQIHQQMEQLKSVYREFWTHVRREYATLGIPLMTEDKKDPFPVMIEKDQALENGSMFDDTDLAVKLGDDRIVSICREMVVPAGQSTSQQPQGNQSTTGGLFGTKATTGFGTTTGATTSLFGNTGGSSLFGGNAATTGGGFGFSTQPNFATSTGTTGFGGTTSGFNFSTAANPSTTGGFNFSNSANKKKK